MARGPSPYRVLSAGAPAGVVRLSYRPCVGIWPVLLALAVAVPLAILARHDSRLPTVVSCTTLRVPGNDKICTFIDPSALGATRQIACGEAPADLEKALSPASPFKRPLVSMTRAETPRANAQCASEGAVGSAGSVFINGKLVSATSGTTSAAPVAAQPQSSVDGVDAEAARSFVSQCAVHPSWTGPIETVTVSVLERDYLASVLIVTGALAFALLTMLRRRVSIDIDGPQGTLVVVERGFFRVLRRVSVPLSEIEHVIVATGVGPVLNGRRVEIACRNGTIVPLVDAYVPLTGRVHDATAARLAYELSAPIVVAPSPKARAMVAFATVATVAAAATMAVVGHLPARHAAPTGDARLARTGEVRDGSTIVLASLGARKIVVVADERTNQIRAVDRPTLYETGEPRADVFAVSVSSPPGAMVMDAKGRLFVAMPREAAIVVYAHSGSTLAPVARIAAESEPIDLALTPDESSLVVLSKWGHALETFRVTPGDAFARTLDVSLARSPSDLAVSGDGKRAYVAHDVGSILTTVDLATGNVATISLDVDDVRAGVGGFLPRGRLPMSHARIARGGSAGGGGDAGDVSRPAFGGSATTGDPSHVFVPGVFVSTGDPNAAPSPSYYGSGSINGGFNVADVDARGWRTLSQRVGPRLTARNGQIVQPRAPAPSANLQPQGCLLPRVALADAEGQWLYVACEGPGRVFKIDVSPSARSSCDGGWWGGLAVGDGPTGMAIDRDGRALLVWSAIAERVTAAPLDPTGFIGSVQLESSTLTVEPPREWQTTLRAPERDARAAVLDRGRHLFYGTGNREISSDGSTCASCHIDGRDDGLTWPTDHGARQTPMLAGRLAGTAPYGWSGLHADLRTHLVDTFQRLNAQETIAPADEDALIAFVQALPPPPPATPSDLASVDRGRAIFESPAAGCSGCHTSADGVFTDTEKHDLHMLGAPAPPVRGRRSRRHETHETNETPYAFDTPSLLYVGGTAPYFHDGRFATLRQLLDGVDGKMGHTSQLSDADKNDLVHYLDTIGPASPAPPPPPSPPSPPGT